MIKKNIRKIAIIGGGASGIFASLRCAEVARNSNIPVQICVFETSAQFLTKVRISGGGRCNVTHHLFDIDLFRQNYPRGQKELISPFNSFQAKDMVGWLKEKGVELKSESDGRMFPATNKSQTIIDCFLVHAKKLKIELLERKNVKSLKRLDSGKISLFINEDEDFLADSVLIATGSRPGGYRLAKGLGHSISPLAPSLFTFKIRDPILKDLSGISFENSALSLIIEGSKTFHQTGPLLITHWGLSGPALLKLSAWAAREMQAASYKAKIQINWLAMNNEAETKEMVRNVKQDHARSLVANAYPEKISKRFWIRLLEKCHISGNVRWADLDKKSLNKIVSCLYQSELQVEGKSRFKEEFVECGGIDLREIDMKKMESKICKNLYFAGEVMDIDGITGGFNFQNAWTSGWIAGTHLPSASV